jgi:methylenetetrahydrofolate reductase (NADPH)
MNSSNNLKKVLSEKKFAVTAEVGPPKGSDPKTIIDKAHLVKNCADAFNITDNQTAVVRMSSLAGCTILLKMNMEPIMQLSCRDRNRIALQSEILGACAIGVKNILLLTGDHQSMGNHPDAKGVFDIDSIQLIEIAKNMRDFGKFQNGDDILSGKPDIFIGAAINPFVEPLDFRIERLRKKIVAGADFIQTQSVYNLEKFLRWMDQVRSEGLDKKVHILAGITPLKSSKMANRMMYHVPGVDIPEEKFNRIVKSNDPKREGYLLAIETIEELKKINGIHGIHITALFWEEIIPTLVQETKIHTVDHLD